jgi:uncharacterized RDD family membrane protein YckC
LAAFEKLTIDTPEHIALEFTLASAGSRFLALAVDTLIQAGVFVAVSLLALGIATVAAIAVRDFAPWVLAILVFSGFILYYAYFAFFEAIWSGQTPGKRIVGLRVIATSGRPLGVFEAILRNLLRIVDQMPVIYAVGIFSVFLTERNQRLGDLAAGTVVVHDRQIDREALGRAPSSTTVRLGAARLTPEEVQTIETFLRRRDDLPYEMRDKSGGQLAKHVRARLGIDRALYSSDETLLEDAVAEYRSGGRFR